MTHYLTDPFRQPREEAMTEPTPSTAEQFTEWARTVIAARPGLDQLAPAPQDDAPRDDLDLMTRIARDTKENR